MEYTVLSDTAVKIYGECNVSDLYPGPQNEGCEVMKIAERDESLESYYINLIGRY